VDNNYLEEKDISFLRNADSHTSQDVTPQYCNFLNVKVTEKPSLENYSLEDFE
jgi:hypothetical protein